MTTALLSKEFAEATGPTRVAAVEAGLPVKMLRVVMRSHGFRITDLAKIIAPRRTLERRLEAGERLSIEESDRLARLIRILELAGSIFDDNAGAMAWLSAVDGSLDGRIPLDLLRTEEGGRMVEDRLLRLKHGFFA
jgi:putative toxin-antitoxin system antitoxin component (TIGR02293 family)